MNHPRPTSRRRFLATGAATATGLTIVPAHVLAKSGETPPSEKITLGAIGVGGHGRGVNLKTFLHEDPAKVLAVCDVFVDRRARAKKIVDDRYKNDDCDSYADFRDVLDRDDIDAVVISTPDHWHALIAEMALNAGKDVFCEKPTLTIEEGQRLTELVRKKDAVFQWGIEDRSVIHYHKMAEWVRNGEIGDLKRIEVGLPKGKLYEAEDKAPVPDELDYPMWLGPAPFHAYTPSRTGRWVWREILDYSGGMITDWGAHLVDTAQLAAGQDHVGAASAEGTGHIPGEDKINTVPRTFDIDYRFPNGVEMRVRSTGPSIRFEGTDGWLGNTGWRGRPEASSKKILQTRYEKGESALPPRPPREHTNFLRCVRSRDKPTYDVETGHRLFTTLHMGHLAARLGRKVEWDVETQQFPNDPEANEHLLTHRPDREEWRSA